MTLLAAYIPARRAGRVAPVEAMRESAAESTTAHPVRFALEVAVAAGHRREAFEACAQLVDLIKERVPIWKRQSFEDGQHNWVGLDA